MVEFTRRTLLASSVVTAATSGTIGSAAGAEDGDTPRAPTVNGDIKRLVTTAFGAEVTGPFVFENGELLFSLQHPSGENPAPYDTASIGVFSGHQFRFDGRNDDFAELEAPRSEEQQGKVRISSGEYEILARNGDPIDGGDELWGHPQTPDGTDLSTFAGSRYGAFGSNPDMNFLVPTDEEGLEGYLYTNLETSPGSIVRTPISRDEDGWSADLENATNVVNTESFREIGGTRINCYGDLSPWNTPMSAEEDYSHTRVSGPARVSDMLKAGTGKGMRGARAFFNRPNPSELRNSLQELYGDEAWYPQGAFALDGLELLAYHLGAEPVDQDGDTNTGKPIGEGYPNPYRLAKIVEITEPTADEPVPVKHHVMGRGAWECPNFMPDERTVYLASDGSNKGIYKFVAEQPIPSYDDRMDVRGTLYAMEVTNEEAAKTEPPAAVALDIDWVELGTASNAEVANWIADYDDVTQRDYLETHAETDWQDDLETALREADQAVVENGNRNYITDEEIVEWADQYEEGGPDEVDEDLRRVPFLETRAAAKEVGATIEFRKAEGIDSRDDAEAGDFVYFGISELNSGMADDEGNVQLERVDGGLVYRAVLDRNYDVSTLEPAVVGPDASDPPSVADDAPINVDNVMVMDDGRVLLCEDADQLGRSYPNDGLWVFEPPASIQLDSVAISYGQTGRVGLSLSSAPTGVSGGVITVSVTDTDVAKITDASYDGDLALTEDPMISEDGTSVTLRFVDLEEAVEPGSTDVQLGSIELEGIGTGTADLTVDVYTMDDDNGATIEPQQRPGIVVTGPPPVGGGSGSDGGDGGAPPTDPDGDGLYEDVNGNGRLDYDDIVTLFEALEDDSTRLNGAAFDFNDNGRLDYDDVVELYTEV
jgi:secreted PhoX family phosphatase